MLLDFVTFDSAEEEHFDVNSVPSCGLAYLGRNAKFRLFQQVTEESIQHYSLFTLTCDGGIWLSSNYCFRSADNLKDREKTIVYYLDNSYLEMRPTRNQNLLPK